MVHQKPLRGPDIRRLGTRRQLACPHVGQTPTPCKSIHVYLPWSCSTCALGRTITFRNTLPFLSRNNRLISINHSAHHKVGSSSLSGGVVPQPSAIAQSVERVAVIRIYFLRFLWVFFVETRRGSTAECQGQRRWHFWACVATSSSSCTAPLVSLLVAIPHHMSFITGPLINSLSSRFKYAKWDVRG